MNLFTFPFYSSLRQQSRYLGCQQVPRALPAPQNRWLPFVLKLPVSGKGLDCIRIFRAHDDSRYKTVASTAFSYDAYSDGQQDYIFYYGGLVAGLTMPCGDYYLEAQGYYSEVFSVVNDLAPYLRCEWKSDGGIYQTGFSNLLYLDAMIAEPTYKIDEEGEEDAEGNFVALRTRVEKTLKLDTVLLPEFLVDALAGIALHTTKQIGRYLEANTLKVTPTWNKKGCAATVEITFLDGAAAVNEGCGTAASFMPIDLSGFVPAACDGTGATWASDAGTARCEQQGGKNTGWLEVQQKDTNPISGTYNQTRWVRLRQDATACPVPLPILRSRKIEDQVYRTNCNPNEVAGFVTFTVPEGQFTGTDQAVIDQQALDYFNANKAAYANANATCSPARRVWIDTYSNAAKIIRITLKRSDTIGDCVVNIFTQIQGDNGLGITTYQASFTKIIPTGQSVLSTTLPQAGYVIYAVEQVGISSVQPVDYDF
jgi:hypothetical protein